jgi:hypothetical protein
MQVVDALNPTANTLANVIRKISLCIGLAGWASLALFTIVPGIALRSIALHIHNHPFIYVQGELESKTLPPDRSFSLLIWNICCVGAGFSISDGGGVPWAFRIDDIINKIIEQDADVNCLFETFDPPSTLS